MGTNALAKIDFDKDQLAVIEAQFFPAGATKAEQTYCFSVAKELGLNPITKEIHFVPRRSKVGDKWINKVEPMVGRDGFLSIAHRSAQLGGIETSCSIKDVPQLENGKWVVKPELVAECTVWRKDSSKPFTGQVAYSEYCQRTADGKPTKFWAEKPETMLKKVAESQVLRKAFNIHGVYCPEEMGAGFELENGEIVTQAIDAEFTRIEPDKSHLSIVKPAQELSSSPPHTSVSTPPSTPPPVVIEQDEEGWPEPPPAKSASVTSSVAQEIIALLEGKNIPYNIETEGNSGFITATSYRDKDLLKSSGFKWNSDVKAWIFTFENEPF